MAKAPAALAGSGTTVSVALSDSDLTELQRSFPRAVPAEVAQTLVQLAAQEWLSWISGRARPGSMSDLEMERIISMFTQISPGEEISASTLFNRLNLPYGRSQYLARAIAERQIRELNAGAASELASALSTKLAEYNGLPKEKRQVQKEHRFDVSQRAGRLLSIVTAEMAPDTRPRSYERVQNPMAGRYSFKLNPQDLEPVLKQVQMYRP
jgi:hypothetical protein